MKKLLVSIVLVFTLTAVTSYFVADPTFNVVEAKEKKKKSYELTWKGFKKRWKKTAVDYDLKKLSKIKNYGVDQTSMGPTKIGTVKENLYVGLNTNRDADGDYGMVTVSGRILTSKNKDDSQTNADIISAGALAVFIADPNLSKKKRGSIIYDKLRITEPFKDREKRTYSYKGITYTAKFKYLRGDYGTLTVSIVEE